MKIAGLAFLILVSSFIIVWICEYCEGRWSSGCDTHIIFRHFKGMYSRFPEKWRLEPDYVELRFEENDQEKILRLYFRSPIDLLRYWLFQNDLESQERKKREEVNYKKLIFAFEQLEKWEAKNG